MQVGYVVLYVNDPEACRTFWSSGSAWSRSSEPRRNFAFPDPEGRWFAVTR